MVNDKYALTESKSHSLSMHICHWLRSMTNVHEHCVWFRLSECIFVIDHGQWQMCMNSVCDLDSVSAYLSLTRSLRGTHKTCVDTPYCAYLSLTTEWDLNSVECIHVIDHWVWFKLSWVHSCHWPFPIKGTSPLCLGIRVIDQMHSCHWPLGVI